MNDPHVVALNYRIEHASWVDWSRAEPLHLHHNAFDIRVEDKRVRFAMREHFAAESEARGAVENYIDAWELDAALTRGPNAFKLRFVHSEIEDRNPTPGAYHVNAGPATFTISASPAEGTVSPASYPPPPSKGMTRSPDVLSMYFRYVGYREGREPLAAMAYFCLDVLLASTEKRQGRLPAAAKRYAISQPVLNRIANLSSKKGGAAARKAGGLLHDLTQKDRHFLEQAVTTIIRRAAEVAHNPTASLQTITMRDFASPYTKPIAFDSPISRRRYRARPPTLQRSSALIPLAPSTS